MRSYTSGAMTHKIACFFLVGMTCAAIRVTSSSHILGVFTTPFLADVNLHTFLMKALAAKGHNVTAIITTTMPSSAAKGELAENYNEIIIQNATSDAIFNQFRSRIIYNAENVRTNLFDMPEYYGHILERSNSTLASAPMRHLFDTAQFDLVILGWTMANDFELGIAAHHFRCPSIVLGTLQATKSLRDLVANPADLTHISHPYLAYVGAEMSFFQRLKNVATATVFEQIAVAAATSFRQEYMYASNFGKNSISLELAKRNVSMVLINNHFSQGNIRANVPGMVEVGGQHISLVPGTIQLDLLEWLDESDEGVIVCSFGAYFSVNDMSTAKQEDFVRAFASISQRVLIRWEHPEVKLPDNVLAVEWIDRQQDVLAHRNVRALITNGGINSINEAMYHGVPVIGIPLFADQEANVNLLVRQGGAVALPLAELNDIRLKEAINRLVQMPEFTRRAREMAGIFKDRPLPPLDTAIYWIEYVLRHRGAGHMQSPAVHMNYFVYNSLDIVGAVLFSLVRLYFAYRTIRFIYGKVKLRLYGGTAAAAEQSAKIKAE